MTHSFGRKSLISNVTGLSTPGKNTTILASSMTDTVTEKVDSKTSYQDFYLKPKNYPRLTPIDMSKAF